MRYLFILFLVSCIIIYFLTYCASITPPGGGPRDTIPPILERSIPPNKSLNFSGTTIQLFYDEYLQIDNLTKQLIVTPIIQGDYEQKIRKNSIELTFSEPFKDNTTYTFNFQEAIKDITEGNVTPDNVLAFSTGDYIDSLYINGKVFDLLSNDPKENFTVCLYLVGDTLDIFNSPPLYLTRTNKEGKYLIENIKNGRYRLYVYNDANSNLKCDMPKEMFGFSSDTIDLQSNIDSIFLKIQYLDMRDIVIQRAGPAGKYFEIKTNKNLVDYSVEPIDVSKTLYHNFGSDHKTIRFYDNIHSSDSIQFKFIAMDSIDNMLIDTLYLKFVESKREKDEFSFTTLPKTKSKITDQFKGSIQFTKPIININFDSLYFKYDSVTYQYINDSIQYELNKRKDLLTFDIELFFSKYIQSLQKSDTAMVNTSEITTGIRRSGGTGSWVSKVMFYIGEGAFISADMDTSKSAVLEYQMLKPQDYGTIKGKVISAYNSFIIQLLKGKKDIIKEVINQKQYEFTNVEPGEYSIRVLIDNNGNGRWEPGNIFKDLEPESVFFFAEEITIRSNWELTDIDLEF